MEDTNKVPDNVEITDGSSEAGVKENSIDNDGKLKIPQAGDQNVGNTGTINLCLKMTGGNSFELTVQKNITILELKDLCLKPSNIPAASQRLIYKGRILKDKDTLEQHNVSNGHTIHLVKVTPSVTTKGTKNESNEITNEMNKFDNKVTSTYTTNASTSSAPTTSAASTSNPLPSGNNMFGGLGGLPNIDSNALMQVLQNPMLLQIMTELANNTDLMRNMVLNNPMVQQLSFTNPMIRHMMENPDTFREVLNSQGFNAAVSNFTNANIEGRNNTQSETSSNTATGNPIPWQNINGTGLGSSTNDLDLSSMMRNITANPEFQQQIMSMLGQGMGGLGGTFGTNPAGNTSQGMNMQPQLPPEQRYALELHTLEEMGFIDRAAVLTALQESDGDINTAISKLLERELGN